MSHLAMETSDYRTFISPGLRNNKVIYHERAIEHETSSRQLPTERSEHWRSWYRGSIEYRFAGTVAQAIALLHAFGISAREGRRVWKKVKGVDGKLVDKRR